MRNMAKLDQDRSSALVVPRNPGNSFERPTLAAGAVLWRGQLPNPEIAIVHRPHYDDWTLPKGKVDPGESLPVTAAREILEETGIEPRLVKVIGNVHYPVGPRTKVVYYWLAGAVGGSFTPNDEVDELRWVPAKQAEQHLSYKADWDILRKARYWLSTSIHTQLLCVRAAKTAAQVELLAPLLAAYRPQRIITVPEQACADTATPLASALDLPLEHDYLSHAKDWNSLATSGIPSIVVANKETIRHAAGRFANTLRTIPAKRASVWVLNFHNGQLIGADYLESPKPAR